MCPLFWVLRVNAQAQTVVYQGPDCPVTQVYLAILNVTSKKYLIASCLIPGLWLFVEWPQR